MKLEFSLGWISGYYCYEFDEQPWPMTVTFEPMGGPDEEPEPEPEPDDGSYMADGRTNFPVIMAHYDATRTKPWRVLVYDPSSKMYVVIKSYLTETEADVAVTCLVNGWSLDDVLMPH